MKAMEELKELLEDELKKIAKKGDISPTELDSVYKAVDVIKDIATIKAMESAEKEQGSEEGQSNRGQSMAMDGNSGHMPWYPYMDGPIWNRSMETSNRGSYNRGSYERGESNDGDSYTSYEGTSNAGRQGRDGDGDGKYSEEGSYRRGRDRMGRYTSRDGGSYETGVSGAYRGYSRHTAKERMIGKLESMLEDAQTERERMAIRECLEELEG